MELLIPQQPEMAPHGLASATTIADIANIYGTPCNYIDSTENTVHQNIKTYDVIDAAISQVKAFRFRPTWIVAPNALRRTLIARAKSRRLVKRLKA